MSKMKEALKSRKFIVNFLRKELIGPSPGFPAIQLDGEEILRAQDPPRQRYSAGVLFPMKSQFFRQDETHDDENDLEDDDLQHLGNMVEGSNLKEPQGMPNENESENPPETDRDMTLANEFLPSAMGLSALIEVSKCIKVEVNSGIYKHYPLSWNRRTDEDGNKSYTKGWWRRPVDCVIELSCDELLGGGSKIFEKPVLEEDGKPVLSLHVVSRPYPQSDNDRSRLITFTLINRREGADIAPNNSDCFFQCGFSISAVDGQPCFLGYPEQPHNQDDPYQQSLDLLYFHKRTFAVGHGCAADWDDGSVERATTIRTEVLPTYEFRPVLPTKLESLDLSMMIFAFEETRRSIGHCTRLTDEYETWIGKQEHEISTRIDYSVELKNTARRHMKDCRECLGRMRDGIKIIENDNEIALAFQLMNEAMLMQHVHYRISTKETRPWVKKSGSLQLERPFISPSYSDSDVKWYPFQLAFILMNIKAFASPHCTDREMVDVIWFPTGGGKTEAYLGLSAFTMFLRRLRNPNHAGTSILMRYTLRLLSTQQFQRAASLICACELIRQREVERLGHERFSIGLWVGGQVTPNTEFSALTVLRDLQTRHHDNKFILLSCPWCGAEMGPQQDERHVVCKGYRKLSRPNRVRFICEDPDCNFSYSDDGGLPISVIDEHIYESPPTLLIGTVDKFAMLAFQPEARKLFGIDTRFPPPELIIQDELHLISGPLGSMVGHYETVINELCVNKMEGKRIPAKIIASTATIAHAENQVKGLYGRKAFLFPAQALKIGDSFFAEEREDKIGDSFLAEEREDMVGRLYVGVFATALPSHVTAQIRTIGTLLQAPKLIGMPNSEAIDPYWTMMGYFNSLRELGHAATLIQADIREFIHAIWIRRGASDLRRFIKSNVELTSRVQSSEIPKILQRLFTPYGDSENLDVVDVCFATNMIQVGLDVPRLSLMTIIGQPKTTSEYIQASSRVGRERPGLVVTNYNPFKPRDRSHYERFRSYHNSIYRHVEPTSVTSFSTPVKERALHALVVILCRFWGDVNLRERPTYPPGDELIHRIKDTIRERVEIVDPAEWHETENLIDEFVQNWRTNCPSRYGGFNLDKETPLIYPAGSQQLPQWENRPYATPSSMRSVDADCSARQLMNGYGE